MTGGRDDALIEELETMEPVRASDDFTARVLAALGVRRRRRRRQRQAAMGLAAVTILAALLAPLAVQWRRQTSTGQLASEAEKLRLEYRQIQAELDALEARERQTAPVIYLGGDDDVDLVLDLAPLMTQPAAAWMPAAEPANYEF